MQCGSVVPDVQRQDSDSLAEILARLVQENKRSQIGEEEAPPPQQAEHFQRRGDERRGDVGSSTADVITAAPTGALPIGLERLLEREIKATEDFKGMQRPLESQEPQAKQDVDSTWALDGSVQRVGSSMQTGYVEQHTKAKSEKTPVDNGLKMQLDELCKEVEEKDRALWLACQSLEKASIENAKLVQEKAAYLAAHQRGIADLERVITTITAENTTLREALSMALSGKKTKRGGSGYQARSSSSHTSSPTPLSSGSVSTETPMEPELEEWRD